MAEGHVITVTGPRAANSPGVVDAHASARSMAACMAMGQAAGPAAALAAAAKTVPSGVSGDTLREHLALDGALLEPVELTAGEERTP